MRFGNVLSTEDPSFYVTKAQTFALLAATSVGDIIVALTT